RLADAAVPAGGEPGVLLLDQARFRESLAYERHGPVARAVVDDDRLAAAHALEAALDPRQPVVGHDDRGHVAPRLRGTGPGVRPPDLSRLAVLPAQRDCASPPGLVRARTAALSRAHGRRFSQARIAAPGSDRAIVTTKKRKPVANAASAPTW